MQEGEWTFFGVTYGRQATSQQEDKVKLLRLSDRAIEKLAKVFDKEVDAFLNREIKLYSEVPNHTCDPETEMFKAENYTLPDEFTRAADRWHNRGDMKPEEMRPDKVKVIMGVKRIEDDVQIAFKKLDSSRILDRESTWFWWNEDTFDTADGPGFVLPEGLCAVHVQGHLYFNRDRVINSFLDLTEYFREVTDVEVQRLIETGPLKWRGRKPIEDTISKRCKRLMSIFQIGGGFENENITTAGIRDVAAEVGITITSEMENGQEVLILPDSSKAVTSVFEILTHHYSPGIWDSLWRRHNSSEVVPGQQQSQ